MTTWRGGRGFRREGAHVYLRLIHTVGHCKAIILQLKTNYRGLPAGPMVKNLASSAGDEGLIPGLGTKVPHAVVQLSPYPTTTDSATSNYDPMQLNTYF